MPCVYIDQNCCYMFIYVSLYFSNYQHSSLQSAVQLPSTYWKAEENTTNCTSWLKFCIYNHKYTSGIKVHDTVTFIFLLSSKASHVLVPFSLTSTLNVAFLQFHAIIFSAKIFPLSKIGKHRIWAHEDKQLNN
jgi:hypothetical protein